MQNEKIYKVAIYCRFSKDDGKIEDSSSIKTQKEMLTNYVAQQPNWNLVEIYSDDGISGLSMDNRPEFQRMLADIDLGKINLVCSKDASRISRNYLESGMLFEIIFPSKGVRYVSVNDGIDTDNQMGMDIAPFKNILNEFFSRDISKKVSSAKKTRLLQGKFMGTYAPYGYKKDEKDRNHLVIDEKTAPIVKRIFEMYLDGFGVAKIKKILSDEKIPKPFTVTFANSACYELKYNEKDPESVLWSKDSIIKMLSNLVYAGNLAGRKEVKPSLKSPNRKRVAKENWLMAYNTHEPIISQEMFDNVQKILKSHRREGKNSGYLNIFSGIIKCETCGHAMCQNKSHRNPKENPIENVDFRCCNYTSNGKKLSGCTSHTVRASVLHKIILEDVRKQAESALKNKNFAENLRKKLSKNTISETADLRKEMRKSKIRLSELDNIFLELYNDKISEKISERNFSMLSQKYEKEQNQLQNRISEIENILSAEDKSKQNVENFTVEIQKYADIIELNSDVIHRLIDKITIGEKYTGEDGEIHQNITIYYKFIGNIS